MTYALECEREKSTSTKMFWVLVVIVAYRMPGGCRLIGESDMLNAATWDRGGGCLIAVEVGSRL
jgi:hypothetical protein